MSRPDETYSWDRYQFPSTFVLGFHGCDRSVGEAILKGEVTHLSPSTNDYDWLGSGIYFWQSSPLRALEFARERAEGGKNSRGTVTEPFVIGAVLNLDRCLDLQDSAALAELRESYNQLKSLNIPLPSNGPTLKQRKLDCAVFNLLHERRGTVGLAPYSSVRATYREGEPLYPGTDLGDQDHTQICICNPFSILGYFRPIGT